MGTHASSVLFALCLGACKPDADSGGPPVDDTAPPEDTGYCPEGFDVEGYWGDAPDQATRLEVFDALWDTLGASYASFAASGVDWDAVRERYRPLVEAAGSQGRFFQLLADIFLELQDGHSYLVSYQVCAYDSTGSPPALRLMDSASYSGVCLTPLDDDSLLVTRVAADNPAGLAPGDRLIGYDGWRWRHLWTRLLEAELPVCGYHSSADLAQDMNWQSALLNNAHLFDELDIHRHGVAEPEGVSTELFAGYSSDLVCTDQLPVAGVELPYTDWAGSHGAAETSWGILEGTNIGYIYVYAWSGDVTTDFETAVSELMGTDGLVIDQRYNTGGGTGAAMGGLSPAVRPGRRAHHELRGAGRPGRHHQHGHQQLGLACLRGRPRQLLRPTHRRAGGPAGYLGGGSVPRVHDLPPRGPALRSHHRRQLRLHRVHLVPRPIPG